MAIQVPVPTPESIESEEEPSSSMLDEMVAGAEPAEAPAEVKPRRGPVVPKAPKASAVKGGAQAVKPKAVRRTAGREVGVKPAKPGLALGVEHKKAARQAKAKLEEINKLGNKQSGLMWDVAEIVCSILSGEGAPNQRQLAIELGEQDATISVWAKTFRRFGKPDERLTDADGNEYSFNEHAERARMLDEKTGEPKDPAEYEAIEKLAKEKGIGFAVARRQRRGDPSFRSSKVSTIQATHTVASGCERSNDLAARVTGAMGQTVTEEEVFQVLGAFRAWATVLERAIERVPALSDPAKWSAAQTHVNQAWAKASQKVPQGF